MPGPSLGSGEAPQDLLSRPGRPDGQVLHPPLPNSPSVDLEIQGRVCLEKQGSASSEWLP